MLSSVTELHAYIDPGQLTTELGGTQEYHHDSWISQRTVRTHTHMCSTHCAPLNCVLIKYVSLDFPHTCFFSGFCCKIQVLMQRYLFLQAIEAFALMVKTTAQTLQAFGTELAETELPNDAEATTNLLQAHTLKKEKMKVGCSSITSIHIKWHMNILYYDYIIFFLF